MLITYTKRNVLMIINYFIDFNLYNKEQSFQGLKQENEYAMDSKSVWQLEIPKINLVAPIAEGIDVDTLNNYIGHFPTTSISNGNIGLAGHNRGYQKNYFERLKELEIGDIIIYKINEEKKEYKVKLIKIIEDTDWTYLGNTENNTITLITCVENESSKRRCIQGEEI